MARTAREIVYSAGMNERPEYYSGRGAIWTDLRGNLLLRIHNKIRDEFGTSAAEAFVTMVENIRCLSATNFLNALYALEARNWVYEELVEESDDIVFSSSHDDTEHIRRSFFAKIGRFPTSNVLYDYHYYWSY